MISILKIIQIILFSIFMLPSLILISREPFIKNKKYKYKRLRCLSFMFLSSMLIGIIISVFISYNDYSYMYMKYAPFMQLWNAIKFVIVEYIIMIVLIIFGLGIDHASVLLSENKIIDNYYIVTEVPERLTFRQKLNYPFLFYEIYVLQRKIINSDEYILSENAMRELNALLMRRNRDA